MTTFRHSSLIVAVGRFRPVTHEDLERSARDDLEDPAFPYPHLKATLTSWEALLDAVGASKNEVVEGARDFLHPVLSTRRLRAFCLLGSRCGEEYCGTWVTVFAGTGSDMLTSVRRIGAYSSTSATNFTGTGRATHIRFRW